MATIVQPDQCSNGHLVGVHNVCTYLTVQNLGFNKLQSVFSMYIYTEVMQSNTMVAEVRGSFFMFVESGCISTNIEFTVP